MRCDLRAMLAALASLAALLCLAVRYRWAPYALVPVAFTFWTAAACWHTADRRAWRGVALEALLVSCSLLGAALAWTSDPAIGRTISAFACTCSLGAVLATWRPTRAPSPAPSRTRPPTAARPR
jgi:hypothetical protein